MIKDVTNRSQRLDYEPPRKNCNGCNNLVGFSCAHYKAYVQTNIHKPTDCKYWIRRADDT